jgi:predicted ATPase
VAFVKSAKRQYTQLKKIHIERFRALCNAEIEFADAITVVCGKNGTSKSSILGIAAQIFSFEKDYKSGEKINFRQVAASGFKSQYSEHFRISDQFDLPGSMAVNIDLFDGYTDQDATARLELMKRGKSPRPVVRNNSTVKSTENASRNFTHPVIFLSLKRLYPIADRNYKVSRNDYLKRYENDFIGLTNELLNRQSSKATGTEGTIHSAVSHGDGYDQESVSAGEDNAGQIVLALMSFRKLRDEYSNYKGGLLLIDEADAALFPTAQINLLKILERECRDLKLQVIMTSHSPTLIEYAHQQAQQFRRRFKTIYLSNTFGGVKVISDWSWSQIYADINTTTIAAGPNTRLPKINVYFEDREAANFYWALMHRQRIKKYLNPLPDISLGCSNYLQLIEKGIPEFSERSIVCLDADAATQGSQKTRRTVVFLPGVLPPDQLIFEHLYNLAPSDNFWQNRVQFTRAVFTNVAADVIRELGITGSHIDLKVSLRAHDSGKKPRELFKCFYKAMFERLQTPGSPRPWHHWIENNVGAANAFLKEIERVLLDVMAKVYAVEPNMVAALKLEFKKA